MPAIKRWSIFSLMALLAVFAAALRNHFSFWTAYALKNALRSDAPQQQLTSNDDAHALLTQANRLSWLFNWPDAEPYYARAEELFRQSGDRRDEIYAQVGRIRAQSERMSYVEVSQIIGKELRDPIVRNDPDLRLWCLAQKGYTDIEIDRETTQQDWAEAAQIAKKLGKSEWQARAKGELGILAFLQGDS